MADSILNRPYLRGLNVMSFIGGKLESDYTANQLFSKNILTKYATKHRIRKEVASFLYLL